MVKKVCPRLRDLTLEGKEKMARMRGHETYDLPYRDHPCKWVHGFGLQQLTSYPFVLQDLSFGFFDPPLVRAGQLVYTIKFTQPPLLCPLFHYPPPPSARTS